MNYKDTLLLPNTSFAMRGNLPNNEPKKYAKWNEQNIYKKMQNNRKNAKQSFTLHDGPPYANGNIHIGHSLNKILKDIIIKYNYFNGKSIKFTPGWDCHGLPIEQQVEKKLGTQKKDSLPKSTLRKLCREHADKFYNIQKKEFQNLGIQADWDKPYLTMQNQFEANIYRELIQVAKNGLLIEKSKPINWSWAARTALAEAEIEYKDKVSDSVFIAFCLDDEANRAINTDNAKLIIWTTTPWTIPANQGVCLNPEVEYILTTDNFIVAKDLYEKLFSQEVLKGTISKTIDITKLEKLNAINPLNDRKSLIMFGNHVTTTDGTGIVHTAPGHGEDDYRVSLKYGLKVIMPVDERGCFDNVVVSEKLFKKPEDFVGMHIFKSHEKIFEILGDALLLHTQITHSYPHCWRTKKPTIFRATKQWFIALDKKYHDNKTLREIALEQIEKTTFYPKTGKNRLKTMVENRPDWCISRQRSWGVPIALFRNKKTKEVILDEKVLNYIAMIFDVKGADAWYDLEIKELLYPGANINPDELEKVSDILDVWFDSGSTQFSVLRSHLYDAGNFPADVYLEGSDQHRGWFQSSLLVSCATQKQAPYKAIITHGFTVDAKGEKMSKSKGNGVEPDKICKELGSEIVRLWVATSDYQNDQKISNDILKQVSEQYRKIRNTIRFLLANTNDITIIIQAEDMELMDKWILKKAKSSIDEIEELFAKYDFVNGLNKLNNFLVVDLSGIYLEFCKDRLYCNSINDTKRISSQSSMAMITKAIFSILAPILTYTIDEAISHCAQLIKDDCEDVFDWQYYKIPEIKDIDFNQEHIFKTREKFLEKVDILKKEKVIKSTLELVIYTTCPTISKLDNNTIEDIFLVSKNIKHKEENPLISYTLEDDSIVEFYKGSREKCPRCWKLRAKDETSLCHRCQEVVKA